MSKITVDDLVQREVTQCVSHLVSQLANNYGQSNRGLDGLIEQAAELCYGVEDWEEAAILGGWSFDEEEGLWVRDEEEGLWVRDDPNSATGYGTDSVSSAENACALDNIEPYQREVFEHWVVSDWLARALEAKGERVDHDFAGLTVWGRTTTGQAISQDAVIQEIYKELVK